MGKVGLASYTFYNSYILDTYSICSTKENQGPIGKLFDEVIDFNKNKQNSFEKEEIYMVKKAVTNFLNKLSLKEEDVSIAFSGDLSNQLVVTSYALRDINIPFCGLYSACATFGLGLILGSFYIENNNKHALVFSSSHNCNSEKQFRYPNEYGCQKPDTSTSTTTSVGLAMLTNTKTKVKITKATIGLVVDGKYNDPNDLGSAMACSCYVSIKNHFRDFNTSIDDYDYIITGDLSYYGSKVLYELFKLDNIDIKNKHLDTGLIIYDRNKQKVNSGGSGAGCCSSVFASYIYKNLLNGNFKKILFCPTGALLNQTITNQKETIPSITHCVCVESDI